MDHGSYKGMPQISPQNQLTIYLVTSRQHWLKCLQINHKPFHQGDMKLNFSFNKFSTDFLTD